MGGALQAETAQVVTKRTIHMYVSKQIQRGSESNTVNAKASVKENNVSGYPRYFKKWLDVCSIYVESSL